MTGSHFQEHRLLLWGGKFTLPGMVISIANLHYVARKRVHCFLTQLTTFTLWLDNTMIDYPHRQNIPLTVQSQWISFTMPDDEWKYRKLKWWPFRLVRKPTWRGAGGSGAPTPGPMSLMSVSFLPSRRMVVTVPTGAGAAAPAAGTGDLVPLREIVGAGEGVEPAGGWATKYSCRWMALSPTPLTIIRVAVADGFRGDDVPANIMLFYLCCKHELSHMKSYSLNCNHNISGICTVEQNSSGQMCEFGFGQQAQLGDQKAILTPISSSPGEVLLKVWLSLWV